MDAHQQLLGFLFSGGEWVEIRVKAPGSAHLQDRLFLKESDVSESGADDPAFDDVHVWFGVAPRTKVEGQLGGRKEHCLPPRAFFVDCDSLSIDVAEILEAAVTQAVGVQPSAVVWSGGGFHLYWFISNSLDAREWESRQRGVVDSCLAADPSCKDITRLLRLPNTVNPKNGQLCRVLKIDPDLVYPVTYFPEAARKTVERAESIEPGGRNPALWELGTALKWHGGLRGDAMDRALKALNSSLTTVPLPESEVESMVERLNDPRAPQPLEQLHQISDTPTPADLATLAGRSLSERLLGVRVFGKIQWHHWDEDIGIWVEGGELGPLYQWLCEMRTAAQEARDDQSLSLIQRTLTQPKMRDMLNLMSARQELPILIDSQAVNALPFILPLRNGYLNLHTSELIGPSPSHYFTMRADAEWREGATSSAWESFLDRLMPDKEEQKYLGECFFYCLTGNNTARSFFINLGGGRNGKTVAWEVLVRLMGDFAIMGDDKVIVRKGETGHDEHIAQLLWRRLAVYDEVGRQKLDGGRLKQLTGGRMMRARRIFSHHMNIPMTCKHVLVSNHRPDIDGEDVAIMDRLRYFDWRERLDEAEVDPRMSDVLYEERNGILNWIMSHGNAENPLLSMPPRFSRVAEEYGREENEIWAFCNDHIEATDTLEIYLWGSQVAKKWGDFTGTEPRGKALNAFYRNLQQELERQGHRIEVMKSGGKTKIKGVRFSDGEQAV